MNKTYCPVCRKETEYEVKIVKRHYEDEEVKFTYNEKAAFCKVCGEELFVDSINDENQVEFEKAYKEACSIITNAEIQQILDKYRITKRNLPLVLGLGEQTITRYLDGYIPTRKISDLLKMVLKNPEIYLEYLMKNKNNIKESIYVKTKNQVDKLLGICDNDPFIEDVAEYIISKDSEMTNMMLQKMLYYTELFFIGFNDKEMFKSNCKAWSYGPVYGRIYHEYKQYGSDIIEKEETNIELAQDVKSLVDSIIEAFGCYSGKVLSSFTHTEEPWLLAMKSQSEVIKKEDMLKYAKKILKEYNIKSYKDISKYSVDKFKTYQKNVGK